MIVRGWLALPLLASTLLSAQHEAPHAPPELVEAGRHQFGQSCGFCHGADASGARGPDLMRSALVSHDSNGDLIGDVIHKGRPDKGMPALSLSDDQVKAIAAFLHERANEARASNRVGKDYAVARLLTGNAQAGQAYFGGAGGCAHCHSPAGDLKGVASRYTPIELQQHLIYPGGKNKKLGTATVTLTSGESITGPVVHVDDYSIAINDPAGWYRSWDRSQVKVDMQDPLAAHRELLYRLTDADIHNLFAYLITLK